MGSRWDSVVVDAMDPARLGRWWAAVLDYRVVSEESDELVIGRADGSQPELVFGLVADAKSGKNRLHIDLRPDDQDAEVERLIDMGARRVDVGQTEASWVVLADPEGNEFCVLK